MRLIWKFLVGYFGLENDFYKSCNDFIKINISPTKISFRKNRSSSFWSSSKGLSEKNIFEFFFQIFCPWDHMEVFHFFLLTCFLLTPQLTQHFFFNFFMRIWFLDRAFNSLQNAHIGQNTAFLFSNRKDF